jgi:hypothetical protein
VLDKVFNRAKPKIVGALAVAVLSAAGLVLASCGTTTASAPTKAVEVSQPVPRVNVYLTIVTGKMIGKPGWPAFVPSNIEVPAHALVTFHVYSFDDPTDMSGASYIQYTYVKGTVGNTVTVQPFSNTDPNALGPAQTLSRLDPKAGVSHTFTITSLGINVPIAPHAVTTFTIKTGGPGTYIWQCYVPCGTGPTGWGGPMVTNGYMRGELIVK